MQMTVYQLHLHIRRNDVHTIRHDARTFGRFDHGERRMAGEQRRKRARMMGREMLNENNREVGKRGKALEKLRECLDASG